MPREKSRKKNVRFYRLQIKRPKLMQKLWYKQHQHRGHSYRLSTDIHNASVYEESLLKQEITELLVDGYNHGDIDTLYIHEPSSMPRADTLIITKDVYAANYHEPLYRVKTLSGRGALTWRYHRRKTDNPARTRTNKPPRNVTVWCGAVKENGSLYTANEALAVRADLISYGHHSDNIIIEPYKCKEK